MPPPPPFVVEGAPAEVEPPEPAVLAAAPPFEGTLELWPAEGALPVVALPAATVGVWSPRGVVPGDAPPELPAPVPPLVVPAGGVPDDSSGEPPAFPEGLVEHAADKSNPVRAGTFAMRQFYCSNAGGSPANGN